MKYKIEKGIPKASVSAKIKPFTKGLREALEMLDIGDSFKVDITEDISKSRIQTVAHYWGSIKNKKFSTRSTEKEVRIWRES